MGNLKKCLESIFCKHSMNAIKKKIIYNTKNSLFGTAYLFIAIFDYKLDLEMYLMHPK